MATWKYNPLFSLTYMSQCAVVWWIHRCDWYWSGLVNGFLPKQESTQATPDTIWCGIDVPQPHRKCALSHHVEMLWFISQEAREQNLRNASSPLSCSDSEHGSLLLFDFLFNSSAMKNGRFSRMGNKHSALNRKRWQSNTVSRRQFIQDVSPQYTSKACWRKCKSGYIPCAVAAYWNPISLRCQESDTSFKRGPGLIPHQALKRNDNDLLW